MNLGPILKGWRRHHQLTIRAAAHVIGVNYSTLHRLEEGKNIDADLMAVVMRWTLDHGLAGKQATRR
jgi:cytoskeletal protein RodZ